MKIMRLDRALSRRHVAARSVETARAAAARLPVRRGDTVRNRRATMTWETPQARDHRYGFEVTMYIANR